MCLRPDKFDGNAQRGPVRTFAPIVFVAAALRVFGNSYIKRAVGAATDVAAMHYGHGARRLVPATTAGTLSGHHIRSNSEFVSTNPETQSEMVEAGGVEPPSEKRYEPKPTCLAQFICFARRAWNEQETQPASPMNLARALRTERLGPAHCATPLTGPVSKARGRVRLIN